MGLFGTIWPLFHINVQSARARFKYFLTSCWNAPHRPIQPFITTCALQKCHIQILIKLLTWQGYTKMSIQHIWAVLHHLVTKEQQRRSAKPSSQDQNLKRSILTYGGVQVPHPNTYAGCWNDTTPKISMGSTQRQNMRENVPLEKTRHRRSRVLDIDIPKEKTLTKTSNDEGDFTTVTGTKRARRQTSKPPRPLDSQGPLVSAGTN